MLSVMHNLTAMNAQRQLNINTRNKAKATEKLSSGYRINRAADDAAGLSISEKMRRQIRGLTQASDNAQDGISMVQTADGALAEVHDMLHRMNELSVKAANGTNSESDRDAIQAEVDQLVSEVDRVAETTKFNELYLLKGGLEEKRYEEGTSAVFQMVDGPIAMAQDSWASPETGTVGWFILRGETQHMADGSDAPTSASGNIAVHAWSSNFNDGSGDYQFAYIEEIVAVNGYTGPVMSREEMAALLNEKSGDHICYATSFSQMGAGIKEYLNRRTDSAVKDISFEPGTKDFVDSMGTLELAGHYYNVKVSVFADANIENPLSVPLHVGADSSADNKIPVQIACMNARALGINGLRVNGKTGENATRAIDTIEDAIHRVSAQRSSLGAIQNRLEHTVKNLDNVVENTTAAEAQIRDTDMAAAMVSLSKQNILEQVGQSVLAQANQSGQNILSLLS